MIYAVHGHLGEKSGRKVENQNISFSIVKSNKSKQNKKTKISGKCKSLIFALLHCENTLVFEITHKSVSIFGKKSFPCIFFSF